MNYIGIFAGTPTEGEKDGWEVSSAGTLASPIEATVGRSEEKDIKCAVRCEDGYKAAEVELMAMEDWFQFSTDGTNFHPLIILADVGSTNKIFWTRILAGTETGTETGSIQLTADVVNANS